jgi:hypothetical protein
MQAGLSISGISGQQSVIARLLLLNVEPENINVRRGQDRDWWSDSDLRLLTPAAMGIDNESDQVSKGHLVDALALRGDEGRATLRKAVGSCEEALIRGYPNGETHLRSQKLEVGISNQNLFLIAGIWLLISGFT